MTSRFGWVVLAAVSFLSAASLGQIGVIPNSPVQLKDASDPKYRVGDVWEYQTRRREARSRFAVVKVESSPNVGTIVHIGVDNLVWKPRQGDDLSQRVPHVPFSRKALDASAIRRLASNSQLPDFRDDYKGWRQAFLEGHAGIYSIPVKDAVDVAEETWRTGMGCGHAAH